MYVCEFLVEKTRSSYFFANTCVCALHRIQKPITCRCALCKFQKFRSSFFGRKLSHYLFKKLSTLHVYHARPTLNSRSLPFVRPLRFYRQTHTQRSMSVFIRSVWCAYARTDTHSDEYLCTWISCRFGCLLCLWELGLSFCARKYRFLNRRNFSFVMLRQRSKSSDGQRMAFAHRADPVWVYV